MPPIAGRIGRCAVTEGALVTSGQSDAMAMVTLRGFRKMEQRTQRRGEGSDSRRTVQAIRVVLAIGLCLAGLQTSAKAPAPNRTAMAPCTMYFTGSISSTRVPNQ